MQRRMRFWAIVLGGLFASHSLPGHAVELSTVSVTDCATANCCDLNAAASAPCECGNCCGVCNCGGCSPFTPMMLGADHPNVPRLASLTFMHHNIVRVADNNSPLPTDRVGMSYEMYHRAPASLDYGPPNANFHEFEFLAEKTFLDGLFSVELVVPFMTTITSQQTLDTQSTTIGRGAEFGNLGINLKALLWHEDCLAISGGLLVEAPTSRDFRVVLTHNNQFVGSETLKTEAWILTPYLATLVNLSDCWFFQGFVSYRATTAGNRYYDGDVLVGTLRDQDLLMIDGGLGYWLYRDRCAEFLTGLVPTVELHYTTTTTDGEGASGFVNARADYLTLTVGATALLGERTTLAVGAGVPLRTENLAGVGNTDRLYDCLLTAQLNVMR